MKLSKLTFIAAAALLICTALPSCDTVRNVTSSVRQSLTRQQKDSTVVAAIPVQDKVLQTATLTPLETESLIRSVIYGTWTPTEIGGLKVTGENRPTVAFDSAAVNPFYVRYYATTGCNVLNGTLALTAGNGLAPLGDGASTMRLCPDAVYEAPMIEAFNTVNSYTLESTDGDYVLTMKNQAGKTVMVLLKSDMAYINGAWEVTSIGATEVASSGLPDPIRLVIDIPELRVHGSTGCNVLNGDLERNPDVRNSLAFTNIATTRMACPYAGIEQQLTTALGKVTGVRPGPEPDTAELTDAAGNILIQMHRITLTPSDPE